MKRAETSWRQTLWFMVAVQMVMSMALNVYAPILPLFLPEMGLTTSAEVELWSGILSSVNFLVAAFASPLWGALSDRVGRKAMVLRSAAAIIFFTGLLGFCDNVWQLLAVRSLMGAFSGFSAASIALVGSEAPQDRLGYALGWLGTAQLVGALIAPLAGGLLADWVHDYRVVFYYTASLGSVALLLAWGFVPETPRRIDPAEPSVPLFAGFRALGGARHLVPLVFVLLFAQFSIRAVEPLVTLFVKDLLGPVSGLATLAGLAFSITGLSDLLVSPFLGKRSDTLGYRRVLMICLLGAAVSSLPQAFVDSYGAFVAWRFALGMFIGGIIPTTYALVGRHTDSRHRGLVYGVTATATFLGQALGPLTGGAVASVLGIRVPFLVTSGVFLATGAWVWVAVHERQGGARP